jgi:hypothetical protein
MSYSEKSIQLMRLLYQHLMTLLRIKKHKSSIFKIISSKLAIPWKGMSNEGKLWSILAIISILYYPYHIQDRSFVQMLDKYCHLAICENYFRWISFLYHCKIDRRIHNDRMQLIEVAYSAWMMIKSFLMIPYLRLTQISSNTILKKVTHVVSHFCCQIKRQ